MPPPIAANGFGVVQPPEMGGTIGVGETGGTLGAVEPIVTTTWFDRGLFTPSNEYACTTK